MSDIPDPTPLGANSSTVSSLDVSLTLAEAVAVGETIIVAGHWRGSAHPVASVVDSVGNIYTIHGSASATSNSSGLAKTVVTNALGVGNTITLSFSGTTSGALKIIAAVKVAAELDLVDDTDQFGGTVGGGSTFVTPSMDCSDSPGLLIGEVACTASGTPVNWSPTAPILEILDHQLSSSSLAIGYRQLSASGPYTFGGSFSAGTTATARAVIYRSTTVAPPADEQRFMAVV